MALGAVFLSLPLTIFLALYGYAVESLSPLQVLVIYATMGTSIMISFTLLHGLRLDDLG